MKAEQAPTEGWAYAYGARYYHYRRWHVALCTPKKARHWFPIRALQPGDPRKCAKCEAKLAGASDSSG